MIDSQTLKSNRPVEESLKQNKENEGVLQKLDNNRLNIKNRMIASSHSRNRDEKVRESSEANSHSEKITKGKVSMIEPQIIQGMSGEVTTISSSRLPPRATKRRDNQSATNSDSLA